MSKIVDSLVVSLQRTHELSLLTHLHHWNFEGPTFLSVHKLLDENYKQLELTLDAIGERIRTLGYYVAPVKNEYVAKNIDHSLPAVEKSRLQIVELIEQSEVLLKQLLVTREFAEAETDIGTVGLLDSIIPHLGKSIWFYQSLIK